MRPPGEGTDARARKERRRSRNTPRAARPLLMPPTGTATEHLRVPVAKEISVIAPLDPYLTLKAAADYGGTSVRALRTALTDPVHPLPCYRPRGKGGKVLVRLSDFDKWMAPFRVVGDADLDAMVHEVLRDLV